MGAAPWASCPACKGAGFVMAYTHLSEPQQRFECSCPKRPAPHPNVKKMGAAVTRWIAEASARPDAVFLLLERVDWFERSLGRMGRGIEDKSFTGLDAHDIGEAVATLRRAIDGLTQKEAAQ